MSGLLPRQMDEDNADVRIKMANVPAQQETGQRGSTNGLWSIIIFFLFYFWGGIKRVVRCDWFHFLTTCANRTWDNNELISRRCHWWCVQVPFQHKHAHTHTSIYVTTFMRHHVLPKLPTLTMTIATNPLNPDPNINSTLTNLNTHKHGFNY